MEKYVLKMEKADKKRYLTFIYINDSLSGSVVFNSDEYIPFWGMLQLLRKIDPERWGIEIDDEVFWEDYKLQDIMKRRQQNGKR